MPSAHIQQREKTWLDSLLGLAAEVRPGEGTTAALLALNGFLILTAYYVIRPVRSALLNPVRIDLGNGTVIGGPEITSYSGAMLAFLFLFIVPAYGAIASKVNRIRLINIVTLFFVANLVGFFFLGMANASPALLGISFYLWLGIFNLMVVAQFWSFANDLYTSDQGKRLFAIVGFGASTGAIFGSVVVTSSAESISEFTLMLIAAGLLLVCLALTNVIHVRERNRIVDEKKRKEVEQPLSKEGGFKLLLSSRYLLLIALLTLAVQLVNTNGNYLLNDRVTDMARTSVASGAEPGVPGMTERQVIRSYMASIDFWQNVLVVVIQFFFVSRIFKYMGVGGALFILPVLSLTTYSIFAAAPILTLIRLAKIGENATDYSIQNTLRRALFLPTSREAKYKALNAIETFFWRTGDMLSGLTTFIVIRSLGLGVRSYALVNIAIVAVWIVIAVFLARENRQLTSAEPALT